MNSITIDWTGFKSFYHIYYGMPYTEPIPAPEHLIVTGTYNSKLLGCECAVVIEPEANQTCIIPVRFISLG